LDNPYFRRGIRIGFAIGDNADVEMIARVVGDSEAVLKTLDLGLFARLIRFVSVTSVKRVSVSRAQASDITGASIIQELKDQGEIADDDTVSDISYKDTDLADEQSGDGLDYDGMSWDISDWQ
jgi:hypothetical protein